MIEFLRFLASIIIGLFVAYFLVPLFLMTVTKAIVVGYLLGKQEFEKRTEGGTQDDYTAS